MRDFEELAEEVRKAVFADVRPGEFDPTKEWRDVGKLVGLLEERGCFLMTNSAAEPNLKRIASFHRKTKRGYPCVGSSEWGPFATHGEAILRAAHEALFAPRA